MSIAVATVRFGRLRHLAEFPAERGAPLPRPRDACVVRTERGVELGTCLAIAERESSPNGRRALVRAATEKDVALAAERSARDEREVRDLVRARIEKQGLAIRFVAAETLLDGERTLLYYYAQDRVDLRELARDLEAALSTRIELRQVSARERARACGGTGVCGLTLCCSTFLRDLEPVTMRMAKVQGLSLAPDRTSGACGRLRCCLRYENPLYEEARRKLPAPGARVETARGNGVVVALDVLAKKATLETDEGRRLVVFAEEMIRPVPRALPMALESPKPAEPASDAPKPASEPSPSRWRGITRRLLGRFGSGEPTDDPPRPS